MQQNRCWKIVGLTMMNDELSEDSDTPLDRGLTGSDPKTYSVLMPAKNSNKIYIENAYYHVYNRGVEKRKIFIDRQDYGTFLYLLRYYLEPLKNEDIKQTNRSLRKEISLLCYCLMPNHFHLLVKQHTINGMTKLLRAVCTNYVSYFNRKYSRIGPLYQGKYKAALIDNDPYLLHLSRYIHLNPIELDRVGPWKGSDPIEDFPYSTYTYYLGKKSCNWISAKEILTYFRSARNLHLKDYLSYENFVQNYTEDSKNILENLALE